MKTCPALRPLLEAVRACAVCAPHLPHGTRPVLQADARARILVAGQAPGRKVHASGVPFDDASGDRLRQWMGLDRDRFYDPAPGAVSAYFQAPASAQELMRHAALKVDTLTSLTYTSLMTLLTSADRI